MAKSNYRVRRCARIDCRRVAVYGNRGDTYSSVCRVHIKNGMIRLPNVHRHHTPLYFALLAEYPDELFDKDELAEMMRRLEQPST